MTTPPVDLLFEKTRRPVVLGRSIGRGAEGEVFEVTGQPLVVKLLHKPVADYEAKVRAMIAAPLPPPGVLPLGHTVAWPREFVVRSAGPDAVVGHSMPRAEFRYVFHQLYNPTKRGPEVDRLFLIRAAKHLSLALTQLHRVGVLVGDLNESNVVVGRAADVTILDADSFQIRASGRTYRCCVGRFEYTARELFGQPFGAVDRTPETDAFALACCIWLALMEGNHPFAVRYTGRGAGLGLTERIQQGIWAYAARRPWGYKPRPQAPPFRSLPAALRTLFRAAFEAGHQNPQSRPKPSDWVVALAEYETKVQNAPPPGPTVRERLEGLLAGVRSTVAYVKELVPTKAPDFVHSTAVQTWAGRAALAVGASALTLAVSGPTRPPAAAPGPSPAEAPAPSPVPVRPERGAFPGTPPLHRRTGEETPRLWDELRRKAGAAPKPR